MNNFATAILKFRWIIIISVFVLTVLIGYQIKNLQINSDVISSLPDDDQHALLLKQISNKFGGNKMGMIILETDDIFKTDVLLHVKQITDSLRMMDGILSVTSLTNIINIRDGEYGLEVGKLIDEYNLPEGQEEMQKLKDRILSNDMYKGSIVSEDGTATIIIFTLPDDADIQIIANQVKEKTLSLNLDENIYFAGAPMMVTSIADLISNDLITLIPITFIVIAIVLFLGFRSARGVILPLVTAAIAIIWTMGIMSLLGFTMSMVSNNIPIILVAVGSAYTIHVLNRINQEPESNKRKAIVVALAYIFIPVVLAALTTAIGFMSFIFGAYLNMIQVFGIFTALGTFIACLLSLIFIPALIAVFSSDKKSSGPKTLKVRRSFLSEYLLAPLKTLLFKHPKYTIITWSILLMISVVGVFQIERSVDIKDYFKKDNPTRIAEDIMTSKFGGTKPVFVLFKGDMQSPDVLKTMIRMEEYMKQSPDILTTQSVADLILQLNKILGGGDQIPDDRSMIEQLWFLLDGNEYLNRFINEDMNEGIIISKFISPDNQSKIAFDEYMTKFVNENSNADCEIQVTGMPFVDVTMDNSLIKSQFGSLTIAIIAVIIIVGIVMRSITKGIYATMPIIGSIVILFGVMGFASIPLNIATVLVASVALGIGIDYSIHVITHFNHSINKGESIHDALESTIMISGKAIIINVGSVSAGFLVLVFSQMVPLQYFGLLIALSMVGSSLGALTLLPVILILASRKRGVINV